LSVPNGSLLADFPVQVYSLVNQSLAWASDSKQLFAFSYDGYIHRVDVSTRTAPSQWLIRSNTNPTCIALASNGTFIAACFGSSVSFWDTTNQEQIGIIEYSHNVRFMAMSSNYYLVTSGDKTITLRALCGTLPSHYLDNVSAPAFKKTDNHELLYSPLQTFRAQDIQHTEVGNVDNSPSRFIYTLILFSDTHVHQTKG